MQNMAASLFQHELIRTTLAKAKALRSVAEPLITRAKTDNVANRRLVFARLRDRAMVTKLFTDLGPRYAKRAGRLHPRPALRFPCRRQRADGLRRVGGPRAAQG